MEHPSTPASADQQVVFHLPINFTIPGISGDFSAPEVILTRKGISVGSDTFTLHGATRVSYDLTTPRSDPTGWWWGWGLTLIGTILMLPITLIGLPVLVIGIMKIRSSGSDGSNTAKVYLHKGKERQLVYSHCIGCDRQPLENRKRWDFLKSRARQVAEELGRRLIM